MIDELENQLCIRCFIKNIRDRKKKETNDWIESVII